MFSYFGQWGSLLSGVEKRARDIQLPLFLLHHMGELTESPCLVCLDFIQKTKKYEQILIKGKKVKVFQKELNSLEQLR